uniref:SpvB/TcaC N-terminal domain-containing protein n=1 Tax=Chryseobacterium sp. TaxID=1871047 RepID=UPI0025C64787
MKYFYSLIISLISVLGFSQTILYQPESTSRTVQDPQTVILTPGFIATSSTSNPFIAKIGPATENPGGGPSDSQAGATNPSGTTAPSGQSFHDTKGNIEVNGAGQLQFTLPIALPPGVKSVAPQINLVYMSGSGNGIAGYGWNLSGLTSISRVGKNIEKDGEPKSIQLDYSDYYSFNGQKLILKSGEYGKNGAEYVTEKYSNIKIKSIGVITGLAWQGPEYWEVTFEDGSQAWYGATTSGNSTARTPLDYNIVKWKDTKGNYITYNYSQATSTNVSILSGIEWGGNETLGKAHFNKIEFNYNTGTTRSLKESSYVSGISVLQDKLLNNIIVKSSGNQFKKYVIEYINHGTNYQFVNKIIEYNSANEATNPITFANETDSSASNLFRQDSRFDDIRGENVISGDFNGDGKLDFLKENTLMLGRLDGNGDFVNVSYTGKALCMGTYADSNTPFNDQVLITGVINRNLKKGILYFYKYENNSLVNIATKEIDLSAYPQLFEDANPEEMRCKFESSINTIEAKEVDFNGDGLSELILMFKNEHRWTCQDYGFPTTWTETTGIDMNFYIDFKNNIFSPIDDNNFYVDYKNTINIDLDGDGKVELLDKISGTLRFLSFNIQTFKFEKKYSDIQAGNGGYDGALPAIVGDYNGDGKTDILVPVGVDSSDWNMYISSGKEFITHYYSNLYLYKPSHQGAPRKNRETLRSYWAPDLNKDGKSDFLVFESQKWYRDCVLCVNNPDSSYGFNYLRNDGVDTNGKPIFTNVYSIAPKESTDWGDNDSEDINYSMYGEHYKPMFGSFRLSQLNTEFVILHKTKLITWNLGSKVDVLSRIKSIEQGNIKTEIEYSNLEEGNVYKSFYTTSSILYPYANIIQNLNYHVVSKLIRGEKKQEFRYRDLIGHLNGRGIIGFRQVARTNFYSIGFENTIIWNGSEITPLNEGLPYKEWSIRTTDENKIFPVDISISNTQLLSFKQYDYKVDKLVNGQVVTPSVVDANKAKVVTSINPDTTTSKDFLKNIKTVHKVDSYNSLYLPTKSTTTINEGVAISTSELEYYPTVTTPGSNYSIGKPKIRTDIIHAYGDTKSSKEEYVYENNLLKTLKTWNRDNTGYVLETYNYDGFGNITQKVVSNSIDSQMHTNTFKYDLKGRFAE